MKTSTHKSKTQLSHIELPLFICDKIEPNRDIPGSLCVSFFCPTCRRRHWHGWGGEEDPTKPQHRVAHCSTGSPMEGAGYYIVLQLPAGKAVLA